MRLTRAEHNYNRAQKVGRKLAHEAKAQRDLARHRDLIEKGKRPDIKPRSERRKVQFKGVPSRTATAAR